MIERIFRCDVCGFHMRESQVVIAHIPHPKEGQPPVTINQCPECGEANLFTNICDEPGCEAEPSSGWPSPQGYRRTCGAHYRKGDSS